MTSVSIEELRQLKSKDMMGAAFNLVSRQDWGSNHTVRKFIMGWVEENLYVDERSAFDWGLFESYEIYRSLAFLHSSPSFEGLSFSVVGETSNKSEYLVWANSEGVHDQNGPEGYPKVTTEVVFHLTKDELLSLSVTILPIAEGLDPEEFTLEKEPGSSKFVYSRTKKSEHPISHEYKEYLTGLLTGENLP